VSQLSAESFSAGLALVAEVFYLSMAEVWQTVPLAPPDRSVTRGPPGRLMRV